MKLPFLLVWSAANPVEVEPQAILRRYGVFASDDGHHFVGINEATGRTRVSSAITTWDPDTMTGSTQSGRRYRIEGPPDDTGIIRLQWRAWAAEYGITEFTDVTSEYSLTAQPRLN